MSTVASPERNMAKKKPDGPRQAKEPSYDRIEFQAPVDWVEQLDAAANAVGLSRSAYIRLAVNKLMQADKQTRNAN